MTKLTQSYMIGAGTEQLLYETIGACLSRICQHYPNNEALVVPFQNIRWSYQELLEEVDKLATGLLNLGIEKGDRVAIWGPNSVEWVLTQLATARIGAIMVCINPAYRSYELEYALNKTECKALICAETFKNSNYLAMISNLIPELSASTNNRVHSKTFPHLKSIVKMGTSDHDGMLNFDDVCELGNAQDIVKLKEVAISLLPDDPINIQFTSGTTGSPKAATLSHNNILNNGLINGQGMEFTSNDRLCIPVPLYHCFGMVIGVLACITHGATMIFPSPAFCPKTTLETVANERCSALHGVPTMFTMELEDPEFSKYDLSTLRTGVIAGALCPEPLMIQLIEKMHMQKVLICYGQTELSPVNHMTHANDTLKNRTQTVGRPIPHIEVKLVDEHNKVVPIGQQGEICTRGYSVMSQYWNDEEKTKETIRNGWLHSGDLGTMDEYGYVRITGRIKDMIIRGGENIYPREIEDFLRRHPKISEVQVFGVPDKRMGEQICAWVKTHSGESMTEQECKDFCKDQITHFKIPKYVEFVEEYPMTVTGKIRKIDMRDTMIQRLK